MPNDIIKLRYSCGTFTKVSKSDTFLHFTKAFPAAVLDQTELWELTTLRMLRYAFLDGTIQNLDIDKQNLPTLIAGIIASFAQQFKEWPVKVHHFEPGWGIELEALKLIVTAQKYSSNIASYAGFFIVAPGVDLKRKKKRELWFNLMHENFDHFQADFPIYSLFSDIETILGSIQEKDSKNIFLFNGFKNHPAMLKDLTDNIVHKVARDSMFIFVFRGTREEEKNVKNVNGVSFLLPSLYPMLNQFTNQGFSMEYAFIQDFDRDFLLPFDGDYGLCIVCGAGRGSFLPGMKGFLRYAGNNDSSAGTDLLVKNRIVTMSYEDLVQYRLPEFDFKDERDWHSWAKEREWDPSEINWADVTDEISSDPLVMRAGQGIHGIWDPESDASHLGVDGNSILAMNYFAKKQQSLAWLGIYNVFDTCPQYEAAYEYALLLMTGLKQWTADITPNYVNAAGYADRLVDKPTALFFYFSLVCNLFVVPERCQYKELFFLEHIAGLLKEKISNDSRTQDWYFRVCGFLAAVFFIIGNNDSAKRYVEAVPLCENIRILNALMYFIFKNKKEPKVLEVLSQAKSFTALHSNTKGLERAEASFIITVANVSKQRTGFSLLED